MSKRGNQANRAVTTHSEVADVVEENHAGITRRIGRLDQERAHDDIGAAWLIHNRGTKRVVMLAQHFHLVSHCARPKVRPTSYDDPSRLATGMRVYDGDSFHGS